jgi:hypothetical protein
MPISKRCHICQNREAREMVETLISRGFSSAKIHRELLTNGHTFTPGQVTTHCRSHVEIVPVEVISRDSQESKSEISERILTDSRSIQLNIPPIPENCDFPTLVEWVQRSTARIYIKQLAIVEQCQDLYIDGVIKHPTEQIRALKDMSFILDLIWAYRPGTDLTRAIQVIEAEGYSIIDDTMGPKPTPLQRPEHGPGIESQSPDPTGP